MTMQRQCQPLPGKPCASGTQTLSKPCNTQKCPTSVELSESKENRMIMKTIKFSNKPWRYERCIVLEEDFDLVMDNLKQFVNKPRIPHRIVVNNSTLTIFQNFDYSTVQRVIPLKNVGTENSDHDDCIFVTENASKYRQEFCVVQMFEGDHVKQIQQFKKRIDFFQDKCLNKLPIVSTAKGQVELD